ncbi:MAG: energy transducer TonB [Acidobacteria bacterium]|nr:energy transducer TonB [Acidobacteriota bacterium]
MSLKHTVLSVLCMLVFLAFAVATIPDYTPRDLQDPDFVLTEMKKYKELRQELVEKLATASPLEKMALQTRLRNVETIQELLFYITKNGFRMNDRERLQLRYYQIRKPHTLPTQPPAEEESVDDTIHEISEKGVAPPVQLEAPPVEVPPEMIGDGLQGVVKMTFVVNEKGEPTQLTVVEGINETIDNLALQTVADKWRFKPATLNGKGVKVRYNLAIPFNLLPSSKAAGE